MNTIRVWFSKTGDASYISHLDLQRVMHRALKKSKLPVWYSKGFNPHIYLTFALPLPLGQESVCEYLDYRTEEENPDFDRIYYSLKDALPKDIKIYNVNFAKRKVGEISAARYLITLPKSCTEKAVFAVNKFNAETHAFVTKLGKAGGRKKVEKQIDLKEYIKTIHYTENTNGVCFDITLPAGTVTINPALLMGFLKDNYNLDAAAKICRTQVLCADNKIFE